MLLLRLSHVLAAAFSFAILFSYYCYVVWYGFDALPIPTVSETWLYKPANFVSRQVVIAGSLGLVVIHLAIFLATRRQVDEFASIVLLCMALASAFCLGMLGGVCMEDDSPDCLGSVKYHDDFAVTYFLLVDTWMFGMQLLFPQNAFRLICLVVSVGCQTSMDVLTLIASPTLAPSTGTIEWVNTLMVFSFITSFLRQYLPQVHVGVLDPTSSAEVITDNDQVLFKVSNLLLTLATLIIFSSALLMGFAIFFSAPDFHGFPSVSDLFVFAPANSIGRLFGVIGSCLCILVLWQFYYAYRDVEGEFVSPRQAKGTCLVSIMALVSLSLSSCINKIEDSYVHFVTSALFFALFQAFASMISNTDSTMFLFTLSLITKARLGVSNLHLFAVLELVDIISLLLFIACFAVENRKKLQAYPLALYIAEKS